MICPLCKRDVDKYSDHHLIPKSRGGKELIRICIDCHRQLHALYDNKTLETDLNTTESIIDNEQFSKYIKWVKRKKCGVVHKAKRSRKTKRRGRRG
jgi:5-methylcytosine-specific restriction protein A